MLCISSFELYSRWVPLLYVKLGFFLILRLHISHDSGFSRKIGVHLGWLDSLNALLFFCHGNLLFYTCPHSYTFAVRYVNSVLN